MRVLPMLCCVLLTACTLAMPGGRDKPARPVENPITGAAIATTTLDAANPAALPAQPKPAVLPAVEPVQPARIASPQELACIKKGDSWRSAGKAGGEACFTQTKDAGKSCQRESDCDGLCLARSATCAPFTPMFGCNDILQDNGARATLCID